MRKQDHRAEYGPWGEDSPPVRPVTMKDVARLAGVSQPTVSLVLSAGPDSPVAPSTRERVLAAARELEYTPNRAAQSLRSSRSFTVGVIADRIVSEPYAGRIVLGVQRAVQQSGYVCYVVETSETSDGGAAAVGRLVAQGVAGLIYAAPGPETVQWPSARNDVPTVFVNCWPETSSSATIILANEYRGGRDAAAAVLARGHRRIAFLGGPADDYACQERERGTLDAVEDAGLSRSEVRRYYGDYQLHSGYELALDVLGRHGSTALLCGNDRMAVGSLMALHALGLTCPTDVSIVGFDDQPDLSAQLSPPLATVALPHLAMGMAAGRALLRQHTPGRQLIDCEFLDRPSLGAPPPE